MKKLITLASVGVFLLSLQGASLGQEKAPAPVAAPPAAETPKAPAAETPAVAKEEGTKKAQKAKKKANKKAKKANKKAKKAVVAE